ncbi:MAG: divalent-cation tolerance protein CutA [Elusimicrobia bacterium]|nr:divalent-cation tolerance protein CutA [Candidatus Liberimonas magnetica]
MKYIVVFITCANKKEADKIANLLVKEKLCACGNSLKGVRSIYWWKGKIEKSNEVLLLCKSVKIKLDKIIKRVKELHSYDVPEIIALPILGGSRDYLKWIRNSVNNRYCKLLTN